MSMWMTVVALPQAGFAKVQADPSLLEGVLGEEDDALEALGITSKDIAGCDYLTVAQATEAMDEGGLDDSGNETEGDGGDDLTPEGTLDYDAGYGEVMYWGPDAFARAMESSTSWGVATGLETDVDKLTKRAIKNKLYVLVAVS